MITVWEGNRISGEKQVDEKELARDFIRDVKGKRWIGWPIERQLSTYLAFDKNLTVEKPEFQKVIDAYFELKEARFGSEPTLAKKR